MAAPMTSKDLGDIQSPLEGEPDVKLICLGDSAVGKSKLVERFLMDDYKPYQVSTYALTLFRYNCDIDQTNTTVDIWDTAGQERFNKMHPSYYHKSHACILVFDVSRKVTYRNLQTWYDELRIHRANIPCLLVANKIDVNLEITQKSFNFAKKHNLPMYFVSASDGTNVVKAFKDAIKAAVHYKKTSDDITDHIIEELERMNYTEPDDAKNKGSYDSDNEFDDIKT